jgi:purine-binding chemotaxis protein CheW
MTDTALARPSEQPEVAIPSVDVAPGSIVVVVVDGAEFGLPIANVREVLRVPAITRVPFSPEAVAGVVAIRGAVIPVLDLGLQLFSRPADPDGRLVVAIPGSADEPIALLVDAVAGVIDGADVVARDLPPDAAAPLPAGWITALVEPDTDRLVTVLDIEAVIRLDTAAVHAPALPFETPEETE